MSIIWQSVNDTRSNADWSIQISSGANISIARISGKYAGGGFMYVPSVPSAISAGLAGKIVCVERENWGIILEEEGSFCEKIMGTTYDVTPGGSMRRYLLP